MIYNPLAHFVGGRQRDTAYGGPQGEVAGIERDSLLGVYRALFGRNVQLDYIHIDHLSQELLRQYKLVIFPYPAMLPEKAVPELKEYVQGGGALVAEARLAWNNERGLASDRIPGLGLAEVMGCREIAIQTGAKGRTTLRWSSDGSLLPGRWFEETLEPLGPQAKIVATFENGAPAAVESTYGKGKTLMLGSYLSAAYVTQPAPGLEHFYDQLLDWAGVDRPLTVTGGTVEVRYLESGADKLVYIFNHGVSTAEPTITFRFSGSYRATDLVNGSAVELPFTARMEPRSVKVLRLSRIETR